MWFQTFFTCIPHPGTIHTHDLRPFISFSWVVSGSVGGSVAVLLARVLAGVVCVGELAGWTAEYMLNIWRES